MKFDWRFQASIWYRPPKTDNPKQRNARGRLPDKVKNAKTKFRKKGKLPPVKRRCKGLEIPKPVAGKCIHFCEN